MVKAGLVKMRTSVLFAPGDQDSDPGVHSRVDRMMFSVLVLWLLALEVSLVHLLDGVVVQVQVEAWLVFQDKSGHHIKADRAGSSGQHDLIANVALARPKSQS